MSEIYFEDVLPSMILYEINKGSVIYVCDRLTDGGKVEIVNSFTPYKLTEFLEIAYNDTQCRFNFWKRRREAQW